MKSIHRFVKKIQDSDETTKKFWVVLCSVVAMFFVVSLWLAYMNVSIARIPGPTGIRSLAGVSAPADTEVELEKPGFFSIFAAGTKIIFDGLKARLATKNDIVITNQEINFVAEGIEPVAGAKLP